MPLFRLLVAGLHVFALVFSGVSSVNASGGEEGVLSANWMVLSPTKSDLSLWQNKSFEGDTHYTLIDDQATTPYLKAISKQAASGLFFQQEIDISEYPYLNWEWRVDQALSPLDETSKDGDDYAARMYVVVDGGFFFWKTIALNYVWSSNERTNKEWPNAFAGDNAQMIALQGSDTPIKVWRKEKRNLAQDFKAYFGQDIDEIDAIAIMTDTDNAQGEAEARYRRIYFSKD